MAAEPTESCGPSRGKIEKWDPMRVLGVPGESPSVVVVATRRSGKTVLVRHLVGPLFDLPPSRGGYDSVFVCSRSPVTLDAWADIIPVDGEADPFIDLRAEPDFLTTLTTCLAACPSVRSGRKQRQRRTLLILDDFLEVGRTRFNTALNEFYTAGRHLGVTVISITQSLKELSTAVRKNASVTVIGRLTLGADIQSVCDDYLAWCLPHTAALYPTLPGEKGEVPKKRKEYLTALFRACTAKKRYGWIVVDNTARALFSEAVFWYKAPNPRKKR